MEYEDAEDHPGERFKGAEQGRLHVAAQKYTKLEQRQRQHRGKQSKPHDGQTALPRDEEYELSSHQRRQPDLRRGQQGDPECDHHDVEPLQTAPSEKEDIERVGKPRRDGQHHAGNALCLPRRVEACDPRDADEEANDLPCMELVVKEHRPDHHDDDRIGEVERGRKARADAPVGFIEQNRRRGIKDGESRQL